MRPTIQDGNRRSPTRLDEIRWNLGHCKEWRVSCKQESDPTSRGCTEKTDQCNYDIRSNMHQSFRAMVFAKVGSFHRVESDGMNNRTHFQVTVRTAICG